MMKLLRSKRALGTPVSNLIVLTAAVILSTTVVLFAMNVTTSQVQKENLFISSSHVWYVNSTSSVAAIAAINTGPTDIVLAKIVVKGLQCQWNGSNNYVVYNAINGTLPGDLPYVANLTNTANSTVTIGNQPYTFAVAGEGLTVKSGWTIAFYVVIPDRIVIYDLATAARMVISTTQAVYCTETLVQTA